MSNCISAQTSPQPCVYSQLLLKTIRIYSVLWDIYYCVFNIIVLFSSGFLPLQTFVILSSCFLFHSFPFHPLPALTGFLLYSTSPASSSPSAHALNSFSGRRPYSLRNPSTSVAKNSSLKLLVIAKKFPSNSPAL